MTAQELKNSILQLAVQGKLVPQDKNDEPASELLKRIQAEKAQLIKEGKIKKEKALPPITEEELPFDIPESWEWVRHNELFEISGGAQPDKSLFIELPKKGYVRLYQTRDYGKNPVPVYIPEHTATKRTKKE
jgi:type I restriction enzyme S subunit